MPKNKFRIFSKKFLVIINVLLVTVFLLGCLSAYLPPNFFWWASFISLAMPYLAAILILTIIFWLMVKPKLSLISLIGMLLGYKQLFVMFAFNSNTKLTQQPKANTLRLISWNVESLNAQQFKKIEADKKQSKQAIADFIFNQKAAIVCLQEFNSSEATNNLALFSKIYPYQFFPGDYFRNQQGYKSGCIILSKFPIINTKQVKFPIAESVIYADVVLPFGDTVRVFTTHLQSYKFNAKNYTEINKMATPDDEALQASKSVIKKMKLAFIRRTKQAIMVKEEMDKSPYPTIVCGDFNDVPNSFTYFTIKGDFKDAFLQKGFGIGKTFTHLAPTLRIDYILTAEQFDIKGFDWIDENLSDHLLLITDLTLPK